MLKDITCKYIGVNRNKTLEPTKFFYIDPSTGEASPNFDTAEAAVESAKSELRRRDKTGDVIYIAQIVTTLKAERSIESVEYAPGGKK